MCDHPGELVGVQFRRCKLCHLVKTIRINTKHLDAESICPIGGSISGISSDDIVCCIHWLLPNPKGCQAVRRREAFSILEQLPKRITVTLIL